MLDYQAVQEIATRLGYPEAALWVREHQQEYLEGVGSRGFAIVEDVGEYAGAREPGSGGAWLHGLGSVSPARS